MNKIELNIPNGIKFISDIPGYQIPKGHVIIDKGICGCGYTHWCLTNNQPIILCSPRKLLLENKFEQIPGLYYFKNEKEAILEYDKGLDKELVQNNQLVAVDLTEKEYYLRLLKQQLNDWLLLKLNPLTPNFGAPKILVTYDSLKYVLDVVRWFSNIEFQIIVDEHQSIFMDSSFKSEVELDFVEYLKEWPNVCYLSATPMLDKYLIQLDYFKDLPYYRLNWPKNMVSKIQLTRKFTNSIVSSCNEIIQNYKMGNFPVYVNQNHIRFVSNEIVFFCNSVKVICNIIKKAGLTPDECNIVCAEGPANLSKIRSLGSGFGFGKIPKRNEPNKMFTFCTRTAYLGADFYSECASTVVCSNMNIKTMILDVSLDLPQIMGRQRLDSNPFKNQCLLLYTGERKKDCEISYEELCNQVTKKTKESNVLLDLYDRALADQKLAYINKLQRDKSLYQFDYVGISNKTGEPIVNYLVQISELRAWEISQKDYQDTIIIRCGTDDIFELDKLGELSEELSKQTFFKNKMKVCCNFILDDPDYFRNNYNRLFNIIPQNILSYINLLGPSRILALKCEEKEIKDEIESNRNKSILDLSSIFKIGFIYTFKEIKSNLQQVYDCNNIKKTAKASDLLDWFEVKDSSVLDKSTGKRDKGYKILNKKS